MSFSITNKKKQLLGVAFLVYRIHTTEIKVFSKYKSWNNYCYICMK